MRHEGIKDKLNLQGRPVSTRTDGPTSVSRCFQLSGAEMSHGARGAGLGIPGSIIPV